MFLFLFAGFQAKAQENFEPNQNADSEKVDPIVVATVNIYNAKIVSQEGNEIKLSFDLSNREGVQPNVKYAVQLVKKEDSLIADEKVYDEIVNLGQNETIHKEITYSAPSYLNGDYNGWLTSKDNNALSLGMNMAGEVNLSGSGEYIDIDSSQCNLIIDGDEKTYVTNGGFDVSPEEKLSMKCE